MTLVVVCSRSWRSRVGGRMRRDAVMRSISPRANAIARRAGSRNRSADWGVVPILPVNAHDPALVDLGRIAVLRQDSERQSRRVVRDVPQPAHAHGRRPSLADRHWRGARRTAPASSARAAVHAAQRAVAVQRGLGVVLHLLGRTRLRRLRPGRFQDAVRPGASERSHGPARGAGDVSGDQSRRDARQGRRPRRLRQLERARADPDSQNTAIWDAAMRRVLAIDGRTREVQRRVPGVPATRSASSTRRTRSPRSRRRRSRRRIAVRPLSGARRQRDDGGCEARRAALLRQGALLELPQRSAARRPELRERWRTAARVRASARPRRSTAAVRTAVQQGRRHGSSFACAPLRNVELTAPYMHDGAYATLEAVVRHYNNVDSAIKAFDARELDPAYPRAATAATRRRSRGTARRSTDGCAARLSCRREQGSWSRFSNHSPIRRRANCRDDPGVGAERVAGARSMIP